MLSRMKHRGPDDQGEVGFSGGWLGHRRLSIVDVAGGHQPLGDASGERWLVGNGEIYNHENRCSVLPPRWCTRRARTATAVALGVFLTGGLDSTLVAAIAARYCAERGQQLKTFAVGVKGSPDVLAARQAARYLDTEHHERRYTAEEALAAVAPVVRAIEHFDVSLVRSAVPNYLLAEMTARHVKVVLTGEGADELFAGYIYFRDFADPDELHDELVANVNGLHNVNLQRCDRVTMAHSLEARVPFLEREVIALALRLPAAWKVSSDDVPEKRLLRQAFKGWLPHELLWREKAQFGDGSGAAGVLTDAIESTISGDEFAQESVLVDPPLRNREELAYHRIWRDHLDGVRPEQTLGRFATA